MTVVASDADSTTLTYSIAGGSDAALFEINGNTGALSFVTAPDYEAPTDADADNVYDVTVQASDGSDTGTQALSITVTDVQDTSTTAPPGYVAYNGHYYKYVKGLFTHAQAKASAEADGGYLGTVTSAGENAFVAALIADQDLGAWLGASDSSTEGTWLWTQGPEGGSPLGYTNWASGEPTGQYRGLKEDYIHMMANDSRWNDAPEYWVTMGYIVEIGNLSYENAFDSSVETRGGRDDAYVFSYASDQASEAVGAGSDTVYTSADGYTLDANVEALVLVGSATQGSGNSDANLLYGNAFAPSVLSGGDGDDTYAFSNAADEAIEVAGQGFDTVMASANGYALDVNVEALVLVASAIQGAGNGSANLLIANASAASTLTGGDGDDAYGFSHANDRAIEVAGEGFDTVYASTDGYTLDANVEALVLAGAATQGSGNGEANLLYANAALGSTLSGGAGSDALVAGLGGDTFIFAPGFGADRVYSFDASLGAGDVVEFQTLPFADFDDLMSHTTEVNGDTLITVDANNSILLIGVAQASLAADDFHFA
jgi:hypothetical protein